MTITIHISKASFFDEKKLEFIDIPEQDVEMEYSLYTISKWEAKWHKPFLSNLESHKKTQEEAFDFVRCMCLDENINPLALSCISQAEQDRLSAYIKDSHTATTVKQKEGPKNREIMTTELIYYNMFQAQIPIECEHWHLNRLLKLLEVFSAKQETPKKMPKADILSQRRALSKARGYK